MSKSANKTIPSTSDLPPPHSYNHHQHPIKIITLPSFQKRKVKKDKIEEFVNKILSRKKNDLTKTHHKIKPPSTIIRNYKNQICHPLFTKKKLKLISIPMKTISYTYQCGHIKIIVYPLYQKQVVKKTTTIKSSSRRHFSYFKCKK